MATWAAAFVALAFAALVLWLRYDALPHADRYRTAIASQMEKATGMKVAIGAIRGDWQGLRPLLTLEGLRIADRADRAAFELDRAQVSVSWWSLLQGRLHFHDVLLFRPQLELRRGADGLIYLADKPLNASGGGEDATFTNWLLSQPRLQIHDAVLVWRDDFLGSPPLTLSSVEIAMEMRGGEHRAALTAVPPPALAGRIDLRADVRIGRREGRWQTDGTVYAEAVNTNLGELRKHIAVPETLRAGLGSVRLWAKIRPEGVDELVADVAMRDAVAQLDADALPLDVASLSARVIYRTDPTGFTFGTERLRFALASGLAAEPGNFSMSRRAVNGQAPRVELRADGIDLKIAAALVDYFPLPRDVKDQVTRFAPRGRIRDAFVAWSQGGPQAYAVKGRFEDLSINAVDNLPGLDGFDGLIDGTEAGGTLALDTKQATLELQHVFRDAIVFDTLALKARWKPAGKGLEVTVEDAQFTNPDAEGAFSGTWHSLPGTAHPAPGFIDLKGRFTRARVTSVAEYVPERLAVTRDWMERSIEAGESDRIDFSVKGDLFEFPFGGDSKGRFLFEGDIRGGRLRYHPEWPPVENIDGSFRFENRAMEIRAKKATIFASRLRDTTAKVEDFAVKPVLVTVQGEADTSGGDSMRFLRESPLVNGPGAFTRAVAIEGPGRLKLRLDYPLGGATGVKVAGEYTFDGATATVARALAMTELKGRLAFSERDVRAQDLAGRIFGQPATLSMATENNQVVTSIAGSAEMAALAPWVPQPFLGRLTGQAPWKARVASGRNGTDVTIESPLSGVASTLPEPLAKRAEESRTLTLSVSRIGTPEEITRASLEGGVFGRVHRAGPPGQERWQAAFRFGSPIASEPVLEGLWLYGAVPALDVDAWQAVFALPQPASGDPADAAGPVAPEAAPAGGGFALRGLDLQMGRVRFLGRDFTDMRAKLAREESGWSGQLDSALIAGDVSWDPRGRGRVVARLARLAIPETSAAPRPAAAASSDRNDSPALDVLAERFDFRGHALGRLELKAEPQGEDWRIRQLDITAKPYTMKATGIWRMAGAGSLTTMAMSVDVTSLNGLFGAFGYGDYVKRGAGRVDLNLIWPGLPSEFALANLAGTMKIAAHDGQFAKIEPGAGKLLGLLSLQTLPRRVTLDFRDVFSEGFAFAKIQGDVKIARGVLLTDNFEISGPAAFVSLAGEVSLPNETQSITMRVVPEVSESMALAATVLGTPVLGLSTLLVSKLLQNPIGKAVAYEYLVTGSWDNPVVTKSPPAKPS